MTPAQTKAALKLYVDYKTDTRAYREIADALGIPTTELNRRMWHVSRNRNY